MEAKNTNNSLEENFFGNETKVNPIKLSRELESNSESTNGEEGMANREIILIIMFVATGTALIVLIIGYLVYKLRKRSKESIYNEMDGIDINQQNVVNNTSQINHMSNNNYSNAFQANKIKKDVIIEEAINDEENMSF